MKHLLYILNLVNYAYYTLALLINITFKLDVSMAIYAFEISSIILIGISLVCVCLPKYIERKLCGFSILLNVLNVLFIGPLLIFILFMPIPLNF
ncbi:hypothetical protein [Staphylococcus massiliensis]|uniref:hypothetical protein n=1 Tax=Staphylococcus massiliensis TaxID=555791 RepID=UPI001EDFF685|nr:hypothetical protein [Staphylococcus massiliensis]MCG3400404.1 hypothetical protein [Staphylococcus massiliensis]